MSAARQAKTQPTRSVTILISGKVLDSRVIFCCTCIPGIYTRVSFGLGPARSRNNKYDWLFRRENHTDGKMYHVKTLWVTLVQLGCVSKISRRKRKLNTSTDMLLDQNAFSVSSSAIVFRAFMDRITLYVYIKSSVQNSLLVML